MSRSRLLAARKSYKAKQGTTNMETMNMTSTIETKYNYKSKLQKKYSEHDGSNVHIARKKS